MRTWRVEWWPRRAVKIRLRDIGAETEDVDLVDRAGPCPFCDRGYITRESHPFSRRWDELPEGAPSYACGLCLGTAWYIPRATREVPRPRSRRTMVLRWTDPETGTVHARLWGAATKRARQRELEQTRGMRPSCGNAGMRARLRLEDFEVSGNITCWECAAVVERRILRDAGVPPLVPRVDDLTDA